MRTTTKPRRRIGFRKKRIKRKLFRYMGCLMRELGRATGFTELMLDRRN